MAEAPGHRLGQIIGDALELSVEPILQAFADQHGLYLDRKGARPARPGKRVTWKDDLGNTHDLDFVLERGGTPTKIGTPAAFIETAWRRYTKHSKAKAQEMQAAVGPLAATYQRLKPFLGAVVAGEWTATSLYQLRSNGFSVLHIEYGEIVRAFASVGIDIAATEGTPDDYLRAQCDTWDRLSQADKDAVGAALRKCAPVDYIRFRKELEAAILRKVDRVIVLPLHGTAVECATVDEALDLTRRYDAARAGGPLVRFEVDIRYTNGDRIQAAFGTDTDAIAFLQTFL